MQKFCRWEEGELGVFKKGGAQLQRWNISLVILGGGGGGGREANAPP